jgi:phosphomannomutase
MIPKVLEDAGYKDVHIVAEQAKPDGDFPTVKSPNPEEPEALKMAMELADKIQADIVIGTDPDCDRLGIAVRNEDGEMTILNGNQAMAVKTYFLLEQWQKDKRLNGKQFIASTIVSTPMIKKIATKFGVEYKEGLTGFKWIAKMVKDFPDLQIVGGGEESFGYMVGDFVRDKDAVTATLLACEIAAIQKEKGSSIYAYLQKIYNEVGYYKEHLISVVKKGKKGAEEISEIMKNLRTNPYLEIAGSKVVRIEDYSKDEAYNVEEGVSEKLNIPLSNVLIYVTEDGSKIAARPSGTEPKIKFYISVNAEKEEMLQEKIDSIISHLNMS